MLNVQNGKIAVAQVLLPVGLVAFVLFLWLAFELTQILHDREAMHQASQQQEKPLQDAEHLRTQLSALANGTLSLAGKGDKDAIAIVDRMKQMGIIPNTPTGPAPSSPGAMGRGAPPPMPPQPPAER